MPLLPFPSESPPWHFSRAADGSSKHGWPEGRNPSHKPSQTPVPYYVSIFHKVTPLISSVIIQKSSAAACWGMLKDLDAISGRPCCKGLWWQGRGPAASLWGLHWAPRTLLSLLFEASRKLWHQRGGLQGLEMLALNLFLQHAVIGLAWGNRQEINVRRVSRASLGLGWSILQASFCYWKQAPATFSLLQQRWPSKSQSGLHDLGAPQPRVPASPGPATCNSCRQGCHISSTAWGCSAYQDHHSLAAKLLCQMALPWHSTIRVLAATELLRAKGVRRACARMWLIGTKLLLLSIPLVWVQADRET